jgi:cation-transporting ATPase E
MDKTGTLTTNRLKLARLIAVGGASEEAKERVRLFASTSLDRDSKSLAAVREALGEARGELLDQLPFKSQNRYSAVRVRTDGGEVALALGAPEALEKLLDRADWRAARDELMAAGLRVLLFAEVAYSPRPAFDGSLEGCILRPLALLGLSDELRPEAPRVLDHLASQRIDFKVISGDNPDTVRATVAPLGGALASDDVVTGDQLESPDAERLIRERHVFGRVSPWQKVRVVRALARQGRQVAMIGDGVNDVLPIKDARLGIAMGDGSRASKTVAGIVLTSNDFALLPGILDEGRIIIRNLRRAGKLFLTKNAYVLILIVGGLSFFGLFPLRPQQVTLLNFLTIGIPALLITLDHSRAGRSRGGYVGEVGGFALRTGVVTGLAGLWLMLLSQRGWWDGEAKQRSVLLSGMVLLGYVNLWRAQIDGEGQRMTGGLLLRWLPAMGIGVYLAVMYVPFAASFFELERLDAGRWAWVALTAGLAWAVMKWADRLAGRGGNKGS